MTGRLLIVLAVVGSSLLSFLRADDTPQRLKLPAVDSAVIEAIQRRPTLSVTRRESPFVAHPQIYDWLLNHPDRVSLAWHRMGVPCLKIPAQTNGEYSWADPRGSVMTWRVISRTEQRIVWYATGQVKPAALMPAIPVQAVATLESPRRQRNDGSVEISPILRVDFATESRAASAILRMLGPAVPHLAEQGAAQILLFFSGPARYLHHYPERIPQLLASALTEE